MLMMKVGLGFLNPPRFLGQELLIPFPGELSLTSVFGLRGTKETHDVPGKQHQADRGGLPRARGWGGVPISERLMFVRCWQAQSREDGERRESRLEPFIPAFAFRGHLMSPHEMGCVQARGHPESTTLHLRRSRCRSEDLLCAGLQANTLPLAFSPAVLAQRCHAVLQVRKPRLRKGMGPRLLSK